MALDLETELQADDTPEPDQPEVDEADDAEDADEADDTTPADDAPEDKPAEAAAPTISAEDAARALGLDPEDIAKARNLKSWERSVNQRSTELGLLAKQLESAKPAPEDDDDVPLDDESMATLQKAVGKVLGVDPSAVAEVVREFRARETAGVEEALDTFMSTHKVAADDIFPYIEALNVPTPRTGREATAVLETAYKAYRADRELSDENIQRLVEERAKKLLAEKTGDGAEITRVKPKRTKAPHVSDDDDALADPLTKGSDIWGRMRGE